jgi:hypothetical protein
MTEICRLETAGKIALQNPEDSLPTSVHSSASSLDDKSPRFRDQMLRRSWEWQDIKLHQSSPPVIVNFGSLNSRYNVSAIGSWEAQHHIEVFCVTRQGILMLCHCGLWI